MRAIAAFACLVACATAGCTRAPEERFVRDVAAALGGASAVTAIRTLAFEGEGETYYLGENRNPDADLPVFRTRFRQVFDWDNGRFRKDDLRLPMFLTGSVALRQVITAVDGDLAYDVSPDGKASRMPEWVARDRRGELRLHPIGLLKAALSDGARLGHVQTTSAGEAIDVTLPGAPVLTLVVDAQTKLPKSISMPSAHPILGDFVEQIEFAGYEPVGGARLPTQIAVLFGTQAVAHIKVLSQLVNFDGALPVPDAVYTAFSKNVRLEAPPVLRSAPTNPPAPPVDAEEIAPGVWYLTGGQYYSVLVEFADHLTLIEAPVDDRRTADLLDKAKALRPDKPVTELVVTHHHFDHIGGVRAAIAAGLKLFVRGAESPSSAAPSPEIARTRFARGSDAFFDDLARRPHTLVPDVLSRAPKVPAITAVDDRYTMRDAGRTMDLYAITGNPYADSLLMAYLPKEKLLVEADVFTPPTPGVRDTQTYPFAANLIENIRRRGLPVDRIVPLHGRVVPVQALIDAAAVRPTPTSPGVPPR
jgi:glyoxylase-like metal-dependent hydrolase (beta-lactamase superfamily II)